MNKNKGCIVELSDGRKGRTFHYKGEVLGKIPVYLCIKTKTVNSLEVPLEYSKQAILLRQSDIRIIGFID